MSVSSPLMAKKRPRFGVILLGIFLFLWRWPLLLNHLLTQPNAPFCDASHPYWVHSTTMFPGAPCSFAGRIPIPRSDESSVESFFWYFPPRNVKKDAPLVLWLQGGPGSTSMIGLFAENGPFSIMNGTLRGRKDGSWNEHYHLVFLDNPVGTGFSIVSNPGKSLNCSSFERVLDDEPIYCEGFPMNQLAVTQDLHKFLVLFYTQFPDLVSSPLYIAGESYAGKYIPSLASYLLQRASDTIPLTGLILGDGLVDPGTQIQTHANHFLQLNLVNARQANRIQQWSRKAVEALEKNDFISANKARGSLFDDFAMYSGNINFYDVRKLNVPNSWTHIEEFLNRPGIQKALHLPPGTRFSARNERVSHAMRFDIMKSTSTYFLHLLNSQKIKILIYAAQFDVRDGIPSQTAWLSRLHNWSDHSLFFSSKTKRQVILSREGLTVGYKTVVPSLVFGEILGAGHLAPMDQPRVMLDLVQDFIVR